MGVGPTYGAMHMGRPRTTGTWKALPQGQARTAPWQAPTRTAPRAAQVSAGNWHALSAYQQLIRGIGEQQPTPASAGVRPLLGRGGVASAVAACFVMLLGAGCASEMVSVRMSTAKKTMELTYTDDAVLALVSKGQCAAGAKPPTEAQITSHLAKKCDGGPSIDTYEVTECPDVGWSWHIEISCDMSSQPEAARRSFVAQLRQLSKLASRPGAEITMNWLPTGSASSTGGSSEPTARPTPRPRPVLERPRPRPRPADESGDDEIEF